jgi:hypothetical protein
MRRPLASLVVLIAVLTVAAPVHAGVWTTAAREAAEAIVQRFGRAAATEGTERLAVRLEALAVRFGDDALNAARRTGPAGLRLLEEAGEHAPVAARLLARYGDDGLWLAGQSSRLGFVARFGDDAAEVLLKHKGLADDLISRLGQPGVNALAKLSGQSGRRLAMMADAGDLARIGRTDELLAVVARYGDRAMDFIWRNKGSLAVGAALTAFLADPESFLDGTRELASVLAQEVGQPLLETVGVTAARNIQWTWVVVVLIVVVGVYVGVNRLGVNLVGAALGRGR